MEPYYIEGLVKVGIAFLVGAILGIEREYRSKPAGFRTMIMICVGSCLFTILSVEASDVSPDRIASNIVTGIGFIGAGVIFKEGLNINGLTTAALIWVTSALGMAAGFGNYILVAIVTVVVLVTLFFLEKLQNAFDKVRKVTLYKIQYLNDVYSKEQLEDQFRSLSMTYNLLNISKEKDMIELTYRIISSEKKFLQLDNFLVQTPMINKFEA